MPVASGQGPRQYNDIDLLDNGEPASPRVLNRPLGDLENRTDALLDRGDDLEDRFDLHTHTGAQGEQRLTRAAFTDINVSNGMCGLDGFGFVPIANLPPAVLGTVQFQGLWDADTNTPTINTGSADPTPGTGNKGHYYIVAVAGTTTVDGENDWNIGDWIISDGTNWEKVDNTTEPRLADLVNFDLTNKTGWVVAARPGSGPPGVGGYEMIDTQTPDLVLRAADINIASQINALGDGKWIYLRETITINEMQDITANDLKIERHPGAKIIYTGTGSTVPSDDAIIKISGNGSQMDLSIEDQTLTGNTLPSIIEFAGNDNTLLTSSKLVQNATGSTLTQAVLLSGTAAGNGVYGVFRSTAGTYTGPLSFSDTSDNPDNYFEIRRIS